MTLTLIIAVCLLVLIAYIFDLTAAKTKVPAVVLLLLLGWGVKQLTLWWGIQVPDFAPLLPVLGTFGLILIVLEGSLELEMNKTKRALVRKSFWGVLVAMLVMAFGLAFAFSYFGERTFKESLTNAIPFCVISSAIAIPSVRSFSVEHKEYVIFESSLSDILGVLFFNFVAFNAVIDGTSFLHFGQELLVMAVVSILATVLLAWLLHRINHHIKFIPIVVFIVLLYEVSKYFHLPGLIFILFFGMAINNLEQFKYNKWVQKLDPAELTQQVHKFTELVAEGAFLIRVLFFMLFGFLIQTQEVLDTSTLGWALGIVGMIALVRAIQLKLSGLPLQPLLFVAPRGLITILLFLSIAPNQAMALVNNSLVIQVIVLSALFMMVGLMFHKSQGEQPA